MNGIIQFVPNWEREILGFNYGTLWFLFILLLIIMVSRSLVSTIIPKFFKKLIQKSHLVKEILESSGKALGLALGCGISLSMIDDAYYFSSSSIVMPEALISWIPSILQLLLVVTLVVSGYRMIGLVNALYASFDKDGELDGTEKTLITAMESILRFIITLFGAIFIADALGFDLNTLIAGLGITGLALALAAKDTISNVFGATVVLLDRPFKVGDWVTIGAVEGEVVEIGLRTTLLRTSMDTVVTMPNANLTNTPVENWGRRRFRRWQPIFKLDINSNPEHVEDFCDGVLSLIQNNKHATKTDASFSKVSTLGPDAIDVGCNIYWDINSGKIEREVRNEFLIEVMKLAKNLDLSFHDGRVRHTR
ncbi:MAG TPA: mechanosensitive ion channel family protein [Candidatus Poseidoniales archaeon]|nr:MAG TPA: mechanosensitive ion channel family protein [Candidatus Poseidoniales archaeon]|tara:strand:+ start:4824 stop:5918 length:1095 start_codon:yes stop_codon:yes gene_type:complete